MSKLITSALTALLLATGSAWADDLAAGHDVPLNDQAVSAASQKALAQVDDFLAKLLNPPAGTSHYAVKLGIVDEGSGYALTRDVGRDQVEYFWINQIAKTSTGFVGSINNTPEVVTHVTDGQKIPFTKADIFDWLYVDRGKLVGNFTACPVLEAGPVEDLKQYEAQTGAACD